MPPVVRELLRILHERSTRAGVAVAAAGLYELCVVSATRGGWDALIVLPLAVGLVWWRSRPAVSMTLAAVTVLIGLVRAIVWTDLYTNLALYLIVVAPIAGGAASVRRPTRVAAAALAATAIGFITASASLTGSISGRPAIVVSTVVVCGGPFLLAWLWSRTEVRDEVLRLLRDRSPSLSGQPPRFWWAAAASTGLYLACVFLDVPTGDFGTILAAAPIAAALVWARSRPDVSLVLTALGLIVIGLVAPFDSRFGSGATLAVYAALIPVFGAAMSGSAVLRRFAVALVVGVALLGSVLAASIGFTVFVLLVGLMPFLVARLVGQWRARGTLRIRLRESERRGRVAERGVQVEQDRNRIAREVHDVVAHSLAVVIAQADGARFAAETKPASVAPALEAIADTARAALGEVRTMLHDLRSVGGEVDVPGPEDIGAVIGTVRALGVEIHEAVFGVEHPLTEDAGLAMFRIAQEALTNALRHGDRSEPLTVDIDWGDQVVVLVVANAVPATAVPATERAGHGIEGMLERAALVGGECTAGIGSNDRFRVRATLPVLPLPDPGAEDEVTDALSRIFAGAPRAS